MIDFDPIAPTACLKLSSAATVASPRVDIQDGKIKNYQIVAPATWNIGPRDTAGVRGPMEQALIGAPIADPTDPVEVGHICRSYDSCLVCTVHAYDAKSGKQLTTFRTA